MSNPIASLAGCSKLYVTENCEICLAYMSLTDIVDIVSELKLLRKLNMSEAWREGTAVDIRQFCDQLASDNERPQLEIILGGEMFHAMAVNILITKGC